MALHSTTAPPLVVDAALVAKWAFPEAGGPAARRVFGAWTGGRVELVAPDLLVPELAALCRQKAARGELPAAQAPTVHGLLLAALPHLVPSRQLADGALALALRHGRPTAEMLHLALALREGCPYVTADERVFRELAPIFPCVRHLEDVGASWEQ